MFITAKIAFIFTEGILFTNVFEFLEIHVNKSNPTLLLGLRLNSIKCENIGKYYGKIKFPFEICRFIIYFSFRSSQYEILTKESYLRRTSQPVL